MSKKIPFINKDGKVIKIDGKTTLGELLKMGIRFHCLLPKEAPMPINPRIYVQKD